MLVFISFITDIILFSTNNKLITYHLENFEIICEKIVVLLELLFYQL